MKRATLIFAILLSGICLRAQSLPEFPVEDCILRGVLPCGAEYYLSHNERFKGHAEFALVQKNFSSPEDARRSLAAGTEFSRNPSAFFASKGVKYGKEGFVSFPFGSTVYRFRNVPTFDSATTDSTLLVIFDLMRHCPSGQAVMVSGDINTATIADRLHMLSLTVKKLNPAPEDKSYFWWPSTRLLVNTEKTECSQAGRVTLSISSPRTPSKSMNTAQPLVSRMFARELGIILENRLSRAFYEAGIPLANYSLKYYDSSYGPSDERVEISFLTCVDSIGSAVGKLACVAGQLDAGGASLREYAAAKETFLYALGKKKPRDSNSAYIDKFIRNYLFNSSLASDKVFYDFFTGKNLPLNVELELFNNYVSALLDSEKCTALTLSFPENSSNADDCRDRFVSSWMLASKDTSVYVPCRADTLKLVQPRGRVKVKSVGRDVVSGGLLWTFGNGVKVVYKKDEAASMMHLAFLIRGGSPKVASIAPGEASFVTDMLGLYKVSGIGPLDFSEMLRSNGITLESSVGLLDLRLRGSAPKEKMPLALASIVSFVTAREKDQNAFEYYRRCEALRLDTRRVSLDRLDDLSEDSYGEGFQYKSGRDLQALGNDLLKRVDKYLTAQFANASDGVFVVIGNMEASDVQKLFSKYLSVFKYSESLSSRPRFRNAGPSGWHTVFGKADGPVLQQAVQLTMSARVPYTKEAEMTLETARLCLAKGLTAYLSPLGYYADVQSSFDLFPYEACHVRIRCVPASESGLPDGVSHRSAPVTLQALRQAIVSISKAGIRPMEFEAYRQEVLSMQLAGAEQPERMIDAVLSRVTCGKNTAAGISESAKTISPEKVSALLLALEAGARTEVVLQ